MCKSVVVLDVVKDWQELIGAIIGTSIPISFWFFIETYQAEKRRSEELFYLQKLLVSALNNIDSIKHTVKNFLNSNVNQLILDIQERRIQGVYATDSAFFPLFRPLVIGEKIFDIKVKSGYLQNQIISLVAMSQDIESSVRDIRGQFEQVIKMHREMGFNKLNPVDTHNQDYRENVERFKKFVEKEFLDKSLSVYSNQLMIALMAVKHMIDVGGSIRWDLKYHPHGRCFVDRKDLQRWKEEAAEELDRYIKAQISAHPIFGPWYQENLAKISFLDKNLPKR